MDTTLCVVWKKLHALYAIMTLHLVQIVEKIITAEHLSCNNNNNNTIYYLYFNYSQQPLNRMHFQSLLLAMYKSCCSHPSYLRTFPSSYTFRLSRITFHCQLHTVMDALCMSASASCITACIAYCI